MSMCIMKWQPSGRAPVGGAWHQEGNGSCGKGAWQGYFATCAWPRVRGKAVLQHARGRPDQALGKGCPSLWPVLRSGIILADTAGARVATGSALWDDGGRAGWRAAQAEARSERRGGGVTGHGWVRRTDEWVLARRLFRRSEQADALGRDVMLPRLAARHPAHCS